MELWKRKTQLFNRAEEKSSKAKIFLDLGLKKKKPSTNISEKLCTPIVLLVM